MLPMGVCACLGQGWRRGGRGKERSGEGRGAEGRGKERKECRLYDFKILLCGIVRICKVVGKGCRVRLSFHVGLWSVVNHGGASYAVSKWSRTEVSEEDRTLLSWK